MIITYFSLKFKIPIKKGDTKKRSKKNHPSSPYKEQPKPDRQPKTIKT